MSDISVKIVKVAIVSVVALFLTELPGSLINRLHAEKSGNNSSKIALKLPDPEDDVQFDTSFPIVKYHCSFYDRRHHDGRYFLHIGYSAGPVPPGVAPDVYEWRSPTGDAIRFVGIGHVDGGVWWIGTIGAEQVTGFNLNGKYHRFIYLESQNEFECWQDGYRHGNY